MAVLLFALLGKGVGSPLGEVQAEVGSGNPGRGEREKCLVKHHLVDY